MNPSFFLHSIPSLIAAFKDLFMSLESRILCILVLPSAIIDKIIALCEIDLSPGIETTPAIEPGFLANNFCLDSDFVIVIKPKIQFYVY